MTKVKMPKPEGWLPYPFDHLGYYIKDQLKQYGDDRAREALEMAAKECESSLEEHKLHSNFICAMAIRALAEEIK